jgi:hypothetical protein
MDSGLSKVLIVFKILYNNLKNTSAINTWMGE